MFKSCIKNKEMLRYGKLYLQFMLNDFEKGNCSF